MCKGIKVPIKPEYQELAIQFSKENTWNDNTGEGHKNRINDARWRLEGANAKGQSALVLNQWQGADIVSRAIYVTHRNELVETWWKHCEEISFLGRKGLPLKPTWSWLWASDFQGFVRLPLACNMTGQSLHIFCYPQWNASYAWWWC